MDAVKKIMQYVKAFLIFQLIKLLWLGMKDSEDFTKD